VIAASTRWATALLGGAMPARPGSARPIFDIRAAALAAGLALLVAQPPLQAQILSDSEARRAILELRVRVDEWQREVHLRIEGLVERVDRLEQALPRGQLDLQNNVQALRQEIAQLRGQLEVQANELQVQQKRQRELASELDGRIKRFEPVAVTIDGKTATVEIAEKRAFDSALGTFRAGDFKGALAAFQAFSTSFPNSAYSASTQYWIGSAHYALRDGKLALSVLEAFAKRFPEHPRAPEAWLTIGTVYADQGDRKEAAEAWKLVLQNYPDSSAAAPARDRLAMLAASPPPEPPKAAPAAPATPPATGRPTTRR
jgi:tol-pal system protein YbgF